MKRSGERAANLSTDTELQSSDELAEPLNPLCFITAC